MWCTRWYLPLVLLPLPIAPPYLLLLFLLSTTLHAKPCFYCIILLTAMYMATCHWPPAPIDTPLSTPWAANITTFADALLSRMPGLPEDMLPATITIAERCWCDLSAGFFEPFNTTRWEARSVEQLRRELEQKLLESRGYKMPIAPHHGSETSSAANATAQPPLAAASQHGGRPRGLTSSVKALWSYLSHPTSIPTEHEVLQDSNEARAESVSPPSPPPSPPPQPSSLLRTEYDLRPCGFDMIVDFSF